jgi:Family of unknown function (DUF5681)
MAKFQPGQSGNPGGRPKGEGEIRELARQHTATAIATLAEICANGRTDSAKVAAASALLDRGWGRPRQDVDSSGALNWEALLQRALEPGSGDAALGGDDGVRTLPSPSHKAK